MASEKDVIHFSGEIHRNANRLLQLINDTIRLSELDAVHMEIVTEKLDVYELAQNCVDTLQVKADKMEVTIRLAGEPCILETSREMINELLYNLCDNAIRYNKKGGRVLVLVGENEYKEKANAAVAEQMAKDVEIDESDPAIQSLRKALEECI